MNANESAKVDANSFSIGVELGGTHLPITAYNCIL